MRRILLIIIPISVVFALIAAIRNFAEGDAIQASLPSGTQVVKIYRGGGGGNGDFVYALKAKISLPDYLSFVKGKGLVDDSLDPTSVIGYEPSGGDLPVDKREGWDEPYRPEVKYYKRHKRHFIRASYNNGIMYYFSRGW